MTQKEYIEKYAPIAMEQQRLYGIPASITLAQGILESASSGSRLARNENNHFGIKATKSWIDAGGKYGLYNDDKPNEKFCSYDSVADSYEHHSKFLVDNKRYAACFALSQDDYKGWARGLQAAGYASDQRYSSSLISIIEKHGLDKYDKMAMTQNLSEVKEEIKEESALKKESEKNLDLISALLGGADIDNEDLKKMGSYDGYRGRINDPVIELIMSLFAPLLAIALSLDQKDEQERTAAAKEAFANRSIDLSALTPLFKECKLVVKDRTNAELIVNNGNGPVATTLKPSDLNRLSLILANDQLSPEDKQRQVGSAISNIVLQFQLSKNYDLAVQQGQQQTLSR